MLAALALIAAVAAHAQESSNNDAEPAPAGPVALPKPSVTQHVYRAGTQELRYTATAGSLPAGDNPAQPLGDMFYVAYTLDGADPANRPVAFVFNGGPGAASAYLHLGTMGPKRVAVNDDGTLPAPPGRLVVNEASWLPFTDMVFVDPIGTGYSRFAKRKKKAKSDESGLWGVRRDLAALGGFIRLYLSRNGRFASPKFIVGESYGGFRAAALPGTLERDFSIALNGTILVSPVIEFSLQSSDAYQILPWAMRLPSYAAAAWHHGKAPARGEGQTFEAFRGEVESFALGDYLTTLARGTGDRAAFFDRLARYTGLEADALRRLGGRIGTGHFAKTLLRDSNRIVSLYDAAIAAHDPNPGQPRFGTDPTLDPVSSRIADAFAGYVATDLGFKTDRAYRMLNRVVSRQWDWKSGINGSQGFVGTADALKSALTRNARLGVLVVHGLYDLVTPYFAADYVIRQMDLPEPLRRNVTLAVYPGGHMMYTHAATRARLAQDAAVFVRRTLSDRAEDGGAR